MLLFVASVLAVVAHSLIEGLGPPDVTHRDDCIKGTMPDARSRTSPRGDGSDTAAPACEGCNLQRSGVLPDDDRLAVSRHRCAVHDDEHLDAVVTAGSFRFGTTPRPGVAFDLARISAAPEPGARYAS